MRAFPGKGVDSEGRGVNNVGMSLRDYFAGQVICHSYPSYLTPEELADQAYGIADAMMSRRNKGIKGV